MILETKLIILLFLSSQDSETLVDNRKSRVRSQITEEQVLVMKEYYARNPRPKREELEKISQKVGLQVRVVQVWFQNNRARDRREGRLVHIPYATPAYPSYVAGAPADFYSPNTSPAVMEEPLDLSTKKSLTSSPTLSPFPYDSDECGAVNLSRKSPTSAASSSSQMTLVYGTSIATATTPPSPLQLEKKMLKRGNAVPNTNGVLFSMERLMYVCSQSPVTSSSPNNNGSCSPNSSDSHSWKQVSFCT